MTTKISTPKYSLAKELANYSWRERRAIMRAAKHLRKYVALVSDEMTPEEEADETIKELEEED